MCDAISKGAYSEPLSRCDPCKLSYSRFLTTDNRFLRLYITVENKSENLLQIATFIVKVCALTWFIIVVVVKLIYSITKTQQVKH